MRSSRNSPPAPEPGTSAAAAGASLRVGLGARSYDIVIGDGLIDDAGRRLAPFLSRPVAAVVTDRTVADLYLARLAAALEGAGVAVHPVVVEPGEATKSLGHVGDVIDALLEAGIERRDLVVALGGGVIGDLAGFVSAILHRGVRFAQIPTTLLAQVDSSVGGKTGVNARHGKNLIGAFHQPVAVLSDTGVLRSLPAREFRAGYAELVKHGLIGDRDLFDWLAERRGAVFAGGPELARAIEASCAIKARIVEEDEREGGRRALLNLGHTFAHALETALAYDDALIHGEAVAIGIVLAFELSARLGHCPRADAVAARDHLAAAGLPTSLAALGNRLPGPAGLVDLMSHDKKVVAGRKTLVLARAIGEAFLSTEVEDDAIRTVIADSLAG